MAFLSRLGMGARMALPVSSGLRASIARPAAAVAATAVPSACTMAMASSVPSSLGAVRFASHLLGRTVKRVLPFQVLPNQIVRSEDKSALKSYNITEHGRESFKAVVKKSRPFTPSLRNVVWINRPYLWKGRPFRELTSGMRKTGGRGHRGRISVRYRGGGHKRRYRHIDFSRSVMELPGVVQRLEYDPNRSCDIALVLYPDGRIHYVIAAHGVLPGDTILASKNEIDLIPGNTMPLSKMPIGTVVHNVELHPGQGGVIARSAGTSCELLDKLTRPGYVLLRMQSKEQRYVPANCMATVGVVSNSLHFLRNLGKAGRSRWLGRKPHVRGVSMNPVDHPMGGGNGKTSGGRPSCSPWGMPTKGYKTGNKKKLTNRFIIVPRGGVERGMSVVDKAAQKKSA